MRNTFAKIITKLTKKNKKIILLSGDIGNKLFDNFKKENPKNFYNCGVAECNMTTVAAGLAFNGFRPFTYTITSFNVLKTIEQIKLDICYQDLPVIIVGVGSGLGYSNLGTTHHSLEDIGLLMNIPKLNIIVPADQQELEILLPQIIKMKKPTFLRLGKKNEKAVYRFKKCNSKIGIVNQIVKGDKICILGYGNILSNCVDLLEDLKKDKITPSIYNFHTLKPINKSQIIKILKKYKKILVIEDHYKHGGLYNLISEIKSSNQISKNIIFSLNAGKNFIIGGGDLKNIHKKLGLDKPAIIKKIKLLNKLKC
jgi:transketolase